MRTHLAIDASRANETHKTGVGWYALHLIEALKTIIPSDITVTLYLREPPSGALAQLPFSWRARIIATPFSRLWTQAGLALALRRDKPQALFIPSHVMPFATPSCVTTVATIHDIASQRIPEAFSLLQRTYLSLTTRFMLAHATTIIVPSEFTKHELLNRYGKRVTSRLEVVPLACDARFATAVSAQHVQDVREKYGLPQKYVLYVGRLERKKGTAFLIEVLAQHNKTQTEPLTLVLAGGRGHGYEETAAAIRRHGMQALVKELQWVPQEDLYALYRGAAALLFPSEYEGFGIPLLEAFSSGTPVIASDIPALRELSANAAVLVPKHATQAWAAELQKLLADNAHADALSAAGHARATAFSWHKTAQKTWEILASCIG